VSELVFCCRHVRAKTGVQVVAGEVGNAEGEVLFLDLFSLTRYMPRLV
jgi:hypothetical protein